LDEDELEDELAELQQEELDNKMLKTGNVPVADKVAHAALPEVATAECMTPSIYQGIAVNAC